MGEASWTVSRGRGCGDGGRSGGRCGRKKGSGRAMRARSRPAHVPRIARHRPRTVRNSGPRPVSCRSGPAKVIYQRGRGMKPRKTGPATRVSMPCWTCFNEAEARSLGRRVALQDRCPGGQASMRPRHEASEDGHLPNPPPLYIPQHHRERSTIRRGKQTPTRTTRPRRCQKHPCC